MNTVSVTINSVTYTLVGTLVSTGLLLFNNTSEPVRVVLSSSLPTANDDRYFIMDAWAELNLTGLTIGDKIYCKIDRQGAAPGFVSFLQAL